MFSKLIQTSIFIQATPAAVWRELTDFAAYPAWNPFLTRVEGDFSVGNIVTITAGGMTFRPRILTFKPGKELRWMGKMGIRGLVDGEHRFFLDEHGDGSTTLRHEEHFKGALVGIFASKIEAMTRDGFEKMNQALKVRAETGR